MRGIKKSSFFAGLVIFIFTIFFTLSANAAVNLITPANNSWGNFGQYPTFRYNHTLVGAPVNCTVINLVHFSGNFMFITEICHRFFARFQSIIIVYDYVPARG